MRTEPLSNLSVTRQLTAKAKGAIWAPFAFLINLDILYTVILLIYFFILRYHCKLYFFLFLQYPYNIIFTCFCLISISLLANYLVLHYCYSLHSNRLCHEVYMPSVNVNKNSCHYAISNRAPEHGTVVVCLHGSGADGIVWSYQLSRLSSQYRVIVPDLPGHGRSEGQPLDSPYAYALWLEDFCLALNISSFFIMGHSFGGAIAQEYTRRYPRKIKGMVLVGTGMRFVLSRAYRELCERAAPSNVDITVVSEILPESFKKGYELLLGQSNAALHADLFAAARFDSSEWVESLDVPALVIWGSRDEITPRELPEELARRLPTARFHIIQGAGHVVMVDARNEFNTIVADFIERNKAATDI
jgi:pimeloyl-ACP methyl ester carboxylesterase